MFQYHLISSRGLLLASLPEFAAEAETAGVHYFQLREKDLQPRELLFLAKEIRPMLKQTQFIINSHLEVALSAGADGVHLQERSLPVEVVRKRYPALKIGYSAHSLEEMKQAELDGADYVFISPVFAPISKSTNLVPHGIDTVSSWCAEIKIPVIALGGVTGKNLAAVKASGCSGAAGISLFLIGGRFTSVQMVV